MARSNHCLRRIGSRLLEPAIRQASSELPSREVNERANAALSPMFPSEAAPPSRSSKPRVILPISLYGIVGQRNGGLFILLSDPVDDGIIGS